MTKLLDNIAVKRIVQVLIFIFCHESAYGIAHLIGYNVDGDLARGLSVMFSSLLVLMAHAYLFLIEIFVRGKMLLVVEIVTSIALFCILYFYFKGNYIPVRLSVLYVSALISIYLFYLRDIRDYLRKSA